MASDGATSTFEPVPRPWFESVVGLWVVLLAGAGAHLALWAGGRLLDPLGGAPWAALLVATAIAAVAYGGFGVGLALVYRRSRGFEPRFALRPLEGGERRWLAGLVGLALAVMVLGAVPSATDLVEASLIGFGTPPYPAGMGGLSLGLAGVNDMVNQAPLVVFGALLGGLLMGPAVGALFHGVLQDTLARAAPPGVAIAATAVAVTLLSGHDELSMATGAVFAFALGVAYAYAETERLLVAMAAYGAFDALALVLAWLDILASLHAHGHLLG